MRASDRQKKSSWRRKKVSSLKMLVSLGSNSRFGCSPCKARALCSVTVLRTLVPFIGASAAQIRAFSKHVRAERIRSLDRGTGPPRCTRALKMHLMEKRLTYFAVLTNKWRKQETSAEVEVCLLVLHLFGRNV